MGVGTFIDILASILIPVVTFVTNWQFRIKRGYTLSAAADFTLALASFDLAALAAHEVFEKAIRYAPFQSKFVTIFTCLFGMSLVAWMWAFLPLEERLVEAYDPRSNGSFTGNTAIYFFGSWAGVGVLLAAHIFIFLFG